MPCPSPLSEAVPFFSNWYLVVLCGLSVSVFLVIKLSENHGSPATEQRLHQAGISPGTSG